MRRSKKEIKDKSVIIELLNTSHVGRLGTITKDGYPMVKPLSFAYHNGRIYFHTAKEGEKIEDIKGKTLAFTAETSNSGFKAPSALLASEFNMVSGTDYTPTFSGKHDNSILGVANKDYPAAAIANSVKERMIAREVVKAEDFVVLYTSETFPTTGYGVAHNLTPELQTKIQEAFFSFNWEGTALLAEFAQSEPPQEKFVSITFKDNWSVIRQIDEATEVSYSCQ